MHKSRLAGFIIDCWWIMEAPTGQRFCVVRPQRPAAFTANARLWKE